MPTRTYREKDVTSETLYLSRRGFLLSSALGLGGGLLQNALGCEQQVALPKRKANTYSEITRYNNYYEFSTNKEVIHVLAQSLRTDPWVVTLDGEVKKPLQIGINEIDKRLPTEQRIYPLRCVEGWSMVIPWNGFPLCNLLSLVDPIGSARFVQFTGLHRPAEMIGQRKSSFPWPYVEGLRLDEAMHPLTFVATGLYGKPLPKQNGSPLRLVVPWKYGFKSIKAITKITFTKERPLSSWTQAAPSEYGFYANVNPKVRHPRWNQRFERRIGDLSKRPTEMFNGFGLEVAHLYRGMDLAKNF